MSLWGKLAGAGAGAYIGGPLGAMFGAVAGHYVLDRPLSKDVVFTIALIALSAKMAKADGAVSAKEIEAFYHICHVPDKEQKNVARIYHLAQEDVAGYDSYAKQLADIYKGRQDILTHILDALFYIAYADGALQKQEEIFLKNVSQIFGMKESDFRCIHAHHKPDLFDPYLILGIAPSADDDSVRQAWHKAAQTHHPDRLVACGLPKDMHHLANQRMSDINKAWEMIAKERGLQ